MSAKLDRRKFVGGFDARGIMGSNEGAIQRLWREKRGEAKPPDLANELSVQLGLATEDLNRRWYERQAAQRVVRVQEHVVSSVHTWMAATLDGVVEELRAVFESKFMLPW